MPRIHFNVSSALSKWRARGQLPSRRFRMMDLEALRDMPLGPGWFDSSWDLDHGLEVDFALPGDPTFEAWLEAQLRALEPVAVQPAQAVPAENMLEFEPVDWKAWAPADLAADPLPKWQKPGLALLPELKLELKVPEPELELALV